MQIKMFGWLSTYTLYFSPIECQSLPSRHPLRYTASHSTDLPESHNQMTAHNKKQTIINAKQFTEQAIKGVFVATTITTETMSALSLQPKGSTSHGPGSAGVEKLVRLFHIGYRACRHCCNSMDLALPSYIYVFFCKPGRDYLVFQDISRSLDATFTLLDRDANGSERLNSLVRSESSRESTVVLHYNLPHLTVKIFKGNVCQSSIL